MQEREPAISMDLYYCNTINHAGRFFVSRPSAQVVLSEWLALPIKVEESRKIPVSLSSLKLDFVPSQSLAFFFIVPRQCYLSPPHRVQEQVRAEILFYF